MATTVWNLQFLCTTIFVSISGSCLWTF